MLYLKNIWVIKNTANPLAFNISCVRINIACLVSQSITTSMFVYLSETKKCFIKSIEIDF